MPKVLSRRLVVALVVALVVVGLVGLLVLSNPGKTASPVAAQSTVGPSATVPATATAAGGEYLALGDSVAYGVGASPPQQAGYAGVFYQKYLKPARPDVTSYQNFAIPGETTDSFIQRKAGQSQLERAEAELDHARQSGQGVKIITLTIGGNDVVAGRTQPDDAKTAILSHFGANLQTILKELTAHADPQTLLVVTTYYNPFAFNPTATEKAEEVWATQFNDLIRQQAERNHVRVADFYGPVLGHEKEYTRIVQGDIHPNPAGHAVLAEAVWQAVRNEKI